MALFAQFAAKLRRAAVLPDDRPVDRFACSLIPDKSGFALVGDPDRGNIRAGLPGPPDRGTAGLDRGVPQVLGVVLDPTAVRKVLRKLFLCGSHDSHGLVKNDGSGGRRALIDCKDMAHCSALVHKLESFLPVRLQRRCAVVPINGLLSGPDTIRSRFVTRYLPRRHIGGQRFYLRPAQAQSEFRPPPNHILGSSREFLVHQPIDFFRRQRRSEILAQIIGRTCPADHIPRIRSIGLYQASGPEIVKKREFRLQLFNQVKDA